MATAADFRKIALALPGAVEGGHMGHADFRMGGKIFATLGFPDAAHGMVKLSPEEQDVLLAAEPKMFKAANGAWGKRGATLVNLKAANKTTLESALAAAWRNTAPKTKIKTGAPAKTLPTKSGPARRASTKPTSAKRATAKPAPAKRASPKRASAKRKAKRK